MLLVADTAFGLTVPNYPLFQITPLYLIILYTHACKNTHAQGSVYIWDMCAVMDWIARYHILYSQANHNNTTKICIILCTKKNPIPNPHDTPLPIFPSCTVPGCTRKRVHDKKVDTVESMA